MTSLQPLQALSLDSSQQQTFVRYLKTLPEKPNTTVRFFNRVDYYTLHGDDAHLAAREVFKSTAGIKIMGAEPNKMDYIVLSKNNFEKFIRDLLLVKLYRVEVYVNRGTTKSNDWGVEFKGSPGNLSQFEDVLFSNADILVNSTIIAVKFRGDDKNKLVGVACVDCNEYSFSVSEFTDNEHFSELESLVVQLGPKECLLQLSDSPEAKAISAIMERSNVAVTPRKKSEFTTDGLMQDLNRLLSFEEGQQKDANSIPEANLAEAGCCTNVAIKYLSLTSDKDNFENFSFKKLDVMRYVHLDSAAITALNVLPKRDGVMANSKTHSILGLLDRCRTPHGKRLLSQWVRQPLRDMNLIEERLDIVEALIANGEIRRQLFEDHMRRIPDLQAITRRLSREKASLQDCYKIYQTIERVPFLLDCLRQCDNKSMNGAFVGPISDVLVDMEKYQKMMETTIDMDLVDKGEFLVKAEFDDQLKELRSEMKDTEDKMKRQLSKVADKLNLESGKSIKLDFISIHGYHFRITLKDEPIIRKNKSFKILDANKGGVKFSNEELTSLNDDYIKLKNNYEEHQKTVVTEIMRIAGGYSEILWLLSEILAKLDILLAFSIVSCEAPVPYVRPKMVASGHELNLVNARHPCLELQDGISFIANDVHFKEDGTTFNIITGPNMGGKSTYIRSVGVCVLLAHLGCFVPCDSAVVPLLESILARVGADDCQMRGLSTFMCEMVETAAILRTATKNSLVIIDELGRGTSTYEGCGIAWAIAEYLAKETKAFCLFATHFHEITQLASCKEVSNFHVSAVTTGDRLTLLYKVQPGVCDKSFGIHVARMADFPRHVVQFAEDKQRQLESHRFDSAELTKQNHKENSVLKLEAETEMMDFVKACGELDLDNLSESQMITQILKLKNTIKNKDNPYIKALVM